MRFPGIDALLLVLPLLCFLSHPIADVATSTAAAADDDDDDDGEDDDDANDDDNDDAAAADDDDDDKEAAADGDDAGDDFPGCVIFRCRWNIVWAREANAPASSATRSSAAASAAFLGSPRWYGAQALPLQHQPEHGPEEAARSYEALLQTLPEELLPEAPPSLASSRRLPRLDLVLACCDGVVGGLEDAFPSSSSFRWVLPDPSQGQSGAGGICLSLEAVQAAAQVIIHH